MIAKTNRFIVLMSRNRYMYLQLLAILTGDIRTQHLPIPQIYCPQLSGYFFKYEILVFIIAKLLPLTVQADDRQNIQTQKISRKREIFLQHLTRDHPNRLLLVSHWKAQSHQFISPSIIGLAVKGFVTQKSEQNGKSIG